MTLAAALAAAAFVSACADPAPAATPRGPDVLLVVMDTTRADRCSFLGYGRPTTPHLEELARSSVVFDDAWSPAPWTFPAHAALFTGRRPEKLGLVAPTRRPLAADVPTLAGLLAAAGWETGAFTCSSWIAPHSGLSRGFGTLAEIRDGIDAGPAREAHARAVAWMKERRAAGRPFFAFVNDMEPHTCWNPPADVSQRFVDPALPAPAVAEARTLMTPRTVALSLGLEPLADATRRAASDLYDADVASLDEELGKLFATMRAEGLLETTMVIVTADHGEGLGDHGWLEHCAFLHRELLRVPLLVRPPGGTEARRVADVVRLEDVFPTVLDACGVAAPAGIDGAPLLGDTSGREAVAAERVPEDNVEALTDAGHLAEAARLRARRRSLYDGRWHLIVSDPGETELYDVREDPAERRNLAAERPDLAAALRARLDASR